MTIDEAIKNREDCLKYLEGIGPKASPKCLEAVRWSVKALKALRPVSREQVEKVWRGEWKIVEYEFFTCTRCGDSYYNGAESTEQAESYLNSGHVYDFCPHCGSANTEKAVQMVMVRLEAMKDGNGV